jgi:hypothetical protein
MAHDGAFRQKHFFAKSETAFRFAQNPNPEVLLLTLTLEKGHLPGKV